MHEHRTWFPFILIGLTLGLALFFYAVLVEKPSIEPFQSTNESAEILPVTREMYREDIAKIFADYAEREDAVKAYAALIDVRTPAEYKGLHLELVILFGEMKEGKKAEAEARLDVLRRAYPWLP